MTSGVHELLTACEQAVGAYSRVDLSDRLERARGRLADPYCRVAVVGEYKKGKSSLINALLNTSTCPVDVDIATAVPTIVRYSEHETAMATFESADGTNVDEAVEMGAIAHLVTEARDRETSLRSVEIGVPRRLLQSGLALVDTPGVGGLTSVHQASTMAVLPSASAVVFVTDASRELTSPELDCLESVVDACSRVIAVMTKTDFYPEWRLILDLNRARLAERGLPIEMLPISSPLRRQAVADNSADLNIESGFGALVAEIQHVVDASASSAEMVAASAMSDVLDDLRVELRTRLDVMQDPSHVERVLAELAAANEAAERLRTESAGWQTALNDGLADLGSEVDHDLRSRFRRLGAEADAKLDDADPAQMWGEFEPWLAQRVATEATANFTLLREQTDGLTERVARMFAADAVAVQITSGRDVDLPQDGAATPDFTTKSLGARGLTAVRGSYGGMLMFGMFANLAGLALLGPVAPIVGAVLGRRAIKEERERELAQRRQQAKIAYRKYCDEALSCLVKESRDSVRRVSRELRDHFSTLARDLQQTTSATLAAAQQAAEAASSQAQTQPAALTEDLGRLDRLRNQVEQFRIAREGKAP